MSATAYNLLLNTTPTGFGSYTGIVLTNSGNHPVKYNLSISQTTFQAGTVSESTAFDGTVYDTLFITDDINNVKTQTSNYSKIINQSDSGIFYIVNKPFNTFLNVASRSTGLEYATLNIKSQSSVGDIAEDINIYITGQRITGCPISNNLGGFYAVKGHNATDGPNLNFNFQSIYNFDYFTGFNLQLATDSAFSTIVNSLSGKLSSNNDSNLPLYGNYRGLSGYSFSYKFTGLNFNQDYYARVQSINSTGGTGAFTYATGYNSINFIMDDATYSGAHPSPGENLKLLPTGLYLTYKSDSETDFDLYNFLINSNNGSVDFRYYTGVNIKFYPKTEGSMAQFIASTTSTGAINFVYNSSRPLLFSYDSNNIFRMELEFENIGLYGGGGPTSKNGGPIFNLDNILDKSTESTKKVQYYIYKDLDSLFYAGPGGGPKLTITDNSEVSVTLDGAELANLAKVNFRNVP